MWFKTILIKFLSCIFLTIMLWCIYWKCWDFNNLGDFLYVSFPYILQLLWELLWGGLFKFKSATAMLVYNVFGVDSVILFLAAWVCNDLIQMVFFFVIIVKGLFCLYYAISVDKKTKTTNHTTA